MDEKEVIKIIEEAARKRQTRLNLSRRGLTSLPGQIGRLTNLTALYLYKNQLTELPAQIGRLTKLTQLLLWENQLSSLPAEMANLTNLKELNLSSNQLTELPAEMANLTNLEKYNLWGNQLTELPADICKLTNLTYLNLGKNQLTELPAEMPNLTNLKELWLHNNQLTSFPAEICELTNLTALLLYDNQLTELPAEMGKLTKLKRLGLERNPLESPPAEVVQQGTKAVLAYLRDLQKAEAQKWEAKLLIVGEAGVGKTELVKALHEEEFGGETATEGVIIRPLELKHPKQRGVKMRLNLWDFGGQEIQHATHQFFYSERALFVLAWNARENYEQAKLNDWLELIQARASRQADVKGGKEGWRVPVLLVATHRDFWKPDIPYQELERQFLGIRFLGMVSISNKPPRSGFNELRKALAEAAADLPLMGVRWPVDWQEAENKLSGLVKKKQSRMRLDDLWQLMESSGVSAESREPLARALDSMGKIRVFLDDKELSDVVVLDPQWLTNRIARVLKNEDKDGKEICEHAILKRKHWKVFWPEDDEETHRLFVRMMRNFDLVYELEDTPDGWLVVQLLGYHLGDKDSKKFGKLWSGFEGRREISMKFRLEQSIPPGIPTWFIAREHRFSLELHWRLGVLLADDPKKPRHLGLVQSFPDQRYVEMTVRGPAPYNFFVLIRDGLDFTLGRFPGLRLKRKVPCPGHDKAECSHEFDLKQLEKAIERPKPKLEIECPEAFEDVSISGMLFGLHWRTRDNVIKRIDELEAVVLAGDRKILTELGELRELTQREFLNIFKRDQRLTESHCPRVFTLRPVGEKRWGPLEGILKKKWELQLYCEAPGCWHITDPKLGGRYPIKQPAKWLNSLVPHLQRLIKVFKFVAPLAGPWLAYAAPVYEKLLKTDIDLMKELVDMLPKVTKERDLIEESGLRGGEMLSRSEGAGLRAVRRLLDEVDKSQEWGGLKKVLTPEGHYLWLCAEHAEEYAR